MSEFSLTRPSFGAGLDFYLIIFIMLLASLHNIPGLFLLGMTILLIQEYQWNKHIRGDEK